ncbi:MAG: LPD29 domain-containing protein [Cyanobacteria bacterium P01_H01_bin.121]
MTTLEMTAVCKLVRADLKRRFQGCKFSVRKTGFSSIRIEWVDGPTAGVVDQLAAAYLGQRLDTSGVDHIYRTRTFEVKGETVGSDLKYINTCRSASLEAYTLAHRKAAIALDVDPDWLLAELPIVPSPGSGYYVENQPLLGLELGIDPAIVIRRAFAATSFCDDKEPPTIPQGTYHTPASYVSVAEMNWAALCLSVENRRTASAMGAELPEIDEHSFVNQVADYLAERALGSGYVLFDGWLPEMQRRNQVQAKITATPEEIGAAVVDYQYLFWLHTDGFTGDLGTTPDGMAGEVSHHGISRWAMERYNCDELTLRRTVRDHMIAYPFRDKKGTIRWIDERPEPDIAQYPRLQRRLRRFGAVV